MPVPSVAFCHTSVLAVPPDALGEDSDALKTYSVVVLATVISEASDSRFVIVYLILTQKLYDVPTLRPVNLLEDCHVAPPSFE